MEKMCKEMYKTSLMLESMYIECVIDTSVHNKQAKNIFNRDNNVCNQYKELFLKYRKLCKNTKYT